LDVRRDGSLNGIPGIRNPLPKGTHLFDVSSELRCLDSTVGNCCPNNCSGCKEERQDDGAVAGTPDFPLKVAALANPLYEAFLFLTTASFAGARVSN
jgi:hypothetical protein